MKVIKRITYELDPFARAAEFIPRESPGQFDELVIDVEGEVQASVILEIVEQYFRSLQAAPAITGKMPVSAGPDPTQTKPPAPPAAVGRPAVAPSTPAKPPEYYDAGAKVHRPLAPGEPACKGKAKDYAKAASVDAPCGRTVVPGATDIAGLPACDVHAVSLPVKRGDAPEKPADSAKVEQPANKAAETAPQASQPPIGQGGTNATPETPQKAVSADQGAPSGGQSPTPSANTQPPPPSSPPAAGEPPYPLPPQVLSAQMLRDVVAWLREAPAKGGRGLDKAQLLPELERLKPFITCVRQVKDLPKRLERVLAIFETEDAAGQGTAAA